MRTINSIILCLCAISAFGQFSINPKSEIFVGDSTKFRYERLIYNWQTGATSLWGDTKLPQRLRFNVDGGICAVDTVGYLFAGYSKYEQGQNTLLNTISPSFYVKPSGEVYARQGVVQSSDETLKENIQAIPNPLDKIIALRGVTYTFRERDSHVTTMASRPQSQQQEHIGLIAQEVESVLPQAVRMLPDSTLGVVYTNLIPVLIEGIKQLNTEVKALKAELASIQPDKANLSPKSKGTNSTGKHSQAILYQNTPNPFNQETSIAYMIPSDVDATIQLFDLSGQKIKCYPLSGNNGCVTISASELAAGIYVYSLVIDGKEVDAKRLILTE